MNKKKAKNGKIEFYRFIFCIIILLFHSGERLLYNNAITYSGQFDLTFFSHGMMGVEFFFLVSGYLMASYVYKKYKNDNEKIKSEEIVDETIEYTKKKIAHIFPQHVIAFIISFICGILFRNYGLTEIVKVAISSIPQFFFIQMTGAKVNDLYTNNVEWYISAMLVAIVIIYPLLRKNYKTFSKYWAPLIGVFSIGYLISEFKAISVTIGWNHFFVTGTIRAIGVICLGIYAHHIVNNYENKKISEKTKWMLLIIEIITFVILLAFINCSLGKNYELIALMLIFVIVLIAFSGKAKYSEKFNNKFCYFLGKISLPIYLSHLGAVNLVKRYMNSELFVYQVLITIMITIVFSIITYWGGKLLVIMKNKKRVS